MQLRTLGRSDLRVTPLCVGGNVFGWTADEAASFAVLDALIGAGLNFIDTADVYSVWLPGHHGGESETVIGNWLKRRATRNDVVIATKAAAGPDCRATKYYSRNTISIHDQSMKRTLNRFACSTRLAS